MVKNLPANAGDMRPQCDPWVRKIPWRRTWQPTPVFLPENPHGRRSLAATVHRSHKDWDLTKVTKHARTMKAKAFVSFGQ